MIKIVLLYPYIETGRFGVTFATLVGAEELCVRQFIRGSADGPIEAVR